ncbi:site-specific integrase [Mesorhizobium sp. M1348]|uniref:tyrosine-type recombinase/integrase n=1 Tax=Mesorhizobium sp. M1348 TaxID=2957089 RepID=UPI00333567F3
MHVSILAWPAIYRWPAALHPGHAGDLMVMASDDEGETWSTQVTLTSNMKWHASSSVARSGRAVTHDFGRYLSAERGLSPATLSNYLPIVRSFLIGRFENKSMRLDELHPIDVHRFIVRYAKTGSRRRAQLMITALRSFLRFLPQRGAIATDLARAVPGVTTWSLAHLPKSLPAEQVEQMLAFGDRGARVGQRDYAILLFLAAWGCAQARSSP